MIGDGEYIFNDASKPASVAQSDACATGDKQVTGSIPAGSSKFLLWRLIKIQEGLLSVSGERMYTSTG